MRRKGTLRAVLWVVCRILLVVVGVAVLVSLYWLVALLLAWVGHGIAWPISALVGLGPVCPLLAVAASAAGVGAFAWLGCRGKPRRWLHAVLYTLFLLTADAPLLIGFTYCSMGWELGLELAFPWEAGWRAHLLIVSPAVGATLVLAVGFVLHLRGFLPENPFDPPPQSAEPTPPAKPEPEMTVAERRALRVWVCCVVLSGLAFAVLGYTDEGVAGLVAGFVGGVLAAVIPASIISGMVGWILAAEPKASSTPAPSAGKKATTVLQAVSGYAISLGVLAFICHEAYWYFNSWSARDIVNLTYTMGESGKQGESRDKLRADLNGRTGRWALAGYHARPLRWCLTEENRFNVEVTLDLVDIVNGDQPKRVTALDGHPVAKLGAELLLANSDTALRMATHVPNQSAYAHMTHCLKQAWTYQAYEWLAERRERMKQQAAGP